ncbi:hypothetical protein B296_00017729 [Ensete ventricosum]|uniref:Uncharacterized protein n=1 Tax=Ensete ventricosum TaxID=4639 RepID=A0A426ZUZ3_ENSVE|nr:hypothetical protein B296_00017729 [Ensete ventricosum]
MTLLWNRAKQTSLQGGRRKDYKGRGGVRCRATKGRQVSVALSVNVEGGGGGDGVLWPHNWELEALVTDNKDGGVASSRKPSSDCWKKRSAAVVLSAAGQGSSVLPFLDT